jgi:hypothetical protein
MKSASCLAWVGALLSFAIPALAADDRYTRVLQNGNGSWNFERDGRRFFSMGVCHISAKNEGKGRCYDGVNARGSLAKWTDSVVQRMVGAGFNTAGAWCDEVIYQKQLPAARYLWLGVEAGGTKQRLLNVFSPGYEEAIDNLCRQLVAPHRNDPWLIGWFLDNELPWYGEFGWPTENQKSLLEFALDLPAGDANRDAAIRFLTEYYGTFDKFAAEWQTDVSTWDQVNKAPRTKSRRADLAKMAWAGRVAERFYSVVVAAVRKHDRNHLILGSRFAGNAPGPVLAACARHCDVISINRYIKDASVDIDWWDRLYAVVQKPILVTEFSFRSMENRTGNKNTRGADVTVPTQADRAERYRKFVSDLMARPYIVGMHWFEWMDQPENGRSLDGEDSNYGLVDWQDKEYEELVTAAKATHAALLSPNTRRGPLPAAADRDGTQWSAPALAILAEGTLATPVELLSEAQPFIAMDRNGNAQGSAQRDGAQWRIEYDSGTGWGLTTAWIVPPEKPLTGARRVKVIATGAPGTKVAVNLAEFGHDKQPVPNDVADGETWVLREQILTDGKPLVFELGEAEVNPYYGNQKGNRRLDLAGLATVAVHIPGKQGAGSLTITSITLE